MKILRFCFSASLAIVLSLLTYSCSDDDNDPSITPSPNPLETAHFDIWVSIGGNSGMGSSSTSAQLVQSFNSLGRVNDQDSIDFKGAGVDVTAKINQETIIKGKYYYQIPKDNDRFGKYRIGTNGIEIVKEVAYGSNTYKDRRYTHAWIDNKTLVIMAANGDATKIIWTKLDTDNMQILSEGELTFPESATKITQYSTSGIASYRASDNKILYSYLDNKDKKRFYMAFIDPTDMSVEKTVMEDRAEMMAGTAYGELLQSKSFFDTNGDYYLACNTVIAGATSTTNQFGTLLRIKKGETDFDKSYTGFITPSNGKGKIVTAERLTTGKALLYVMDPAYTETSTWTSKDANCYYAILDLNTDKLDILDLAYNKGNFSQRSVVIGEKAYIGVNPEKGAPLIYIYDIPTATLNKGLPIKMGYAFDRIVSLEN